MLLLFLSSFLAATLFPAQSEGVLAALYLTGEYDAAALLIVATIGNVLGACVNWLLGRFALQFQHRAWFPVKPKPLARASNMYQRFGVWTLLFSWLPLIGDAFTLIAGMLKTPLPLFVLLVTIGKASRYAALLAAL